MRTPFAFAWLFLAAITSTGCDLVKTDDTPASQTPASMTGKWETGVVDVRRDTTIQLPDDPTYASVQVSAVYHLETSMSLTDTDGDVRGRTYDSKSVDFEIGYVRRDGVVIREQDDERIAGGSFYTEAVYIAPTLTFASAPYYTGGNETEALTLDFSDGTATFERRGLEASVYLSRTGSREVRFAFANARPTFRRAPTS